MGRRLAPLGSAVAALAGLSALAACEAAPAPARDPGGASRPPIELRLGPTCPSPVPSPARATGLAPPPGWVLTSAPAPSGEALQCANYSRKEWRVDSIGDGVTFAPRPARDADPLPFSIVAKAREGTAGTRHVRAVTGGYLVGFDAGEYGGALFWFSTDGRTRQKLADGNVVAVAELRSGIVAFTGLAHLGVSEGKVLRVKRDGALWAAAPWLDLGAAAEAVAVESPDSALVLTTSSLLRVTSCGDTRQLASPNHDALYPSSMAIDPKGVVYVGMRHYATRFVPQGDGAYAEEWLAPAGCSVARLKKFDCECVR